MPTIPAPTQHCAIGKNKERKGIGKERRDKLSLTANGIVSCLKNSKLSTNYVQRKTKGQEEKRHSR